MNIMCSISDDPQFDNETIYLAKNLRWINENI